jgi:hypothetical protein
MYTAAQNASGAVGEQFVSRLFAVLLRGGEELSNDALIAAFAGEILVINPVVGLFQADSERSIGLPVK